LPWSYAIARNAYIDSLRRRRNFDVAPIDDLPDSSPALADPRTSPDGEVRAAEILNIVKTTLAKLPIKHREAFILVRFEGLTIAEAARVLDTSEASVKVRAFRAYEAFRAALEER
jgi:RNA polymerase sigma-70 factor (ECF subfamily)